MRSKKLLLIIMFFICAFSSFAQTEHLKFMGIPIAGSTIEFQRKLLEKGFSYKEDIEDSDSAKIIEYKGSFAGSNASVYIVSSYDIVWKIEVKITDYNSFSEIENDYKAMVKQYKIKYGNEIEHYEVFTDTENCLSDDDKLQQVKQGQCFYISGWNLENGLIGIRIENDVSLRITYEDAESLKKKEAYSRIQDDI